MKKFLYSLGTLVLVNVVLLVINTYQERALKSASVVSVQSAVSELASSGLETQKTYRVSFTATPEISSEIKPQ